MLKIYRYNDVVEFVSFNTIDNTSKKMLKENENNENKRNYDLESSMRSKKLIRQYGLSNKWNYFITVTINKEKIDRTEHQKIQKKLCKYFNHYKDRYDKNFYYLLVAEPHKRKEKNGLHAVHFHGLLYIENIEYWKLKFIEQKDKAIIYESQKLKNIFGRNDMTIIYNSSEFIAYYISKYMTKNVINNLDLKARYWASKGLSKGIEIDVSETIEQKFYSLGIAPNYQNSFCSKYKFSIAEYKNINRLLIENELEIEERSTKL